MAPTAPAASGPVPMPGPHPSFIQVAKPYLFHQQIQGQLIAIATNPTREDAFRLQGVQWISDVRTALQLPVRTFTTAVSYYHKFRTVHRDTEYQYQDAAAAALLTACKIEDTLKKSREILCAAYNLRSSSEHLSPDDSTFDGPSKAVIGLERLMLESSGFDFRARHPHKHLIKLAKDLAIDREVAKLAYTIMLDLCRTFAPIKQTCAAMSAACIELATRISGQEHDISPDLYRKWRTTRAEVVETLLDLLDLYTHFQKSSIVGPSYDIETFIQLKIQLNQGGENIRYTEEHQAPKTNGARSNIKTPKTPITPASPSDTRVSSKDIMSPATLSPRSSSSRRGLGVRGQDGTVRFMLDAEEAKQEQESVNEYFKVEYEEYEVEVEETIKHERNERHERPHNYNYRNGRGGDDRYHHKRVRR